MGFTAGQQDGKVHVAMTISITNATPVNDHTMIQETTSVGFPETCELFQKVSKLFGVKTVDFGKLLLFQRIITVVDRL